MKRSMLVLALAASAAALTSCGGSGTSDESGSQTPLTVQPADFTITGGPGACVSNFTTPQVFVYGGTAPYRLDNTVPAFVQLNKSTLQSKGESFTVTFTSGCLDPGSIVIVDHLDRQVILTLHNKAGT